MDDSSSPKKAPRLQFLRKHFNTFDNLSFPYIRLFILSTYIC